VASVLQTPWPAYDGAIVRPDQIAHLFDLAVIGGGVNGCGIARDAAGRGLNVLLAEAGDLAAATSSASTKLIHGGLRYLEYWQWRLVAESLAEREALLRIAPHLCWALEFVLPHESHLRPAWLIATGLFLYDRLGGRSSLPGSRALHLEPEGYGAGLKPGFKRGFAYFDCWVDDARLVLLNARSAAGHGAQILPRTRCISARRAGDEWHLELLDEAGRESAARARVLVNAAGPWVKSFLEQAAGIESPGQLRLVKGSHIVVPRIHECRHAFILQNPDRRIVFMIPYERRFTLIGTTDVPVDDAALAQGREPRVSPEEIAYLCDAASRYSRAPIEPAQVAWSYSGVRALYDDGRRNPSAVTRDYHLALDAPHGRAPVVSVFGGKITTYRRLAERVLESLRAWLPASKSWTSTEPLPGGDFGAFDQLLAELGGRYPRLSAELLARLARRHGRLAAQLLGAARSEADLGQCFGGGLYECEARWCIAHEWARTAEDVLWRRTKCGLHMSEVQRQRFDEWMRSVSS
jgi:glycerol-3-phosphate dehydrogenase